MAKQVFLKNVNIFNQLPDPILDEISKKLITRELDENEILFNKGDEGEELVIIEKGSISIFVPEGYAPQTGQPIRLFKSGEVLGEMALIDRKPRSLSARADESTRILVLRGDDFRSILDKNPEIAFLVMTSLSERIRYTTDFLGEVRGWVQRITEGDYQFREFEQTKFKDQTLTNLAAEFTQMAARVHEREELLQKEVIQLRIEIDQVKRKEDAQRIMESDYYKSLKERAKNIKEDVDETPKD